VKYKVLANLKLKYTVLGCLIDGGDIKTILKKAMLSVKGVLWCIHINNRLNFKVYIGFKK